MTKYQDQFEAELLKFQEDSKSTLSEINGLSTNTKSINSDFNEL